jgi:hypothetical protein
LEWDEYRYKEVTDQVLYPDWAKGIKGTHTLTFTEDWWALDTFKR